MATDIIYRYYNQRELENLKNVKNIIYYSESVKKRIGILVILLNAYCNTYFILKILDKLYWAIKIYILSDKNVKRV